MRFPLKSRFYSHASTEARDRHSVSEIRALEARTVGSYEELVEAMAAVAFHNPEYTFFYRGQRGDHRNGAGETTFYPSLYRPGASGRLEGAVLRKRCADLEVRVHQVTALFKQLELPGFEKLARFPELAWSVLQHYEICPTPLVDVTQSLRVAASFATEGGREGYVYAVALPYPSGTLSYSAEEELLMVRLLGICPPAAKRPYFQEGYLVGSFPSLQARRGPHLDLARRLVAKFRIDGARFWSTRFPAIPREALYPEDDALRDALAGLAS